MRIATLPPIFMFFFVVIAVTATDIAAAAESTLASGQTPIVIYLDLPALHYSTTANPRSNQINDGTDPEATSANDKGVNFATGGSPEFGVYVDDWRFYISASSFSFAAMFADNLGLGLHVYIDNQFKHEESVWSNHSTTADSHDLMIGPYVNYDIFLGSPWSLVGSAYVTANLFSSRDETKNSNGTTTADGYSESTASVTGVVATELKYQIHDRFALITGLWYSDRRSKYKGYEADGNGDNVANDDIKFRRSSVMRRINWDILTFRVYL